MSEESEEKEKFFEKAWVKVGGIVATAAVTSLAGYFKSSSETDTKTAASYETLATEVEKLQDRAEKNAVEIARIQGRLDAQPAIREPSGFGSGSARPMPAPLPVPPSPKPAPAAVVEPEQHQMKRPPRWEQAIENYKESKK